MEGDRYLYFSPSTVSHESRSTKAPKANNTMLI